METDDEDTRAAVFVQNGHFKAIWGKSCEDVLQYADVIHEAMINISKLETCSEGDWLWVFSKDCEVVEGNKL